MARLRPHRMSLSRHYLLCDGAERHRFLNPIFIKQETRRITRKPILFFGVVIGNLTEHLQDMYIHHTVAKELWDALCTEYGGSDVGTELYIIEQYHDYKMAEGKSIVEQAHKIQYLVKELDMLKITLPDKFVVGGIIAKLPLSWRDFAISLKHKRTNISISDLIVSLDIEEKSRAKDGRSLAAESQTSTNMVHQLQSFMAMVARARARIISLSRPLPSRRGRTGRTRDALFVALDEDITSMDAHNTPSIRDLQGPITRTRAQ